MAYDKSSGTGEFNNLVISSTITTFDRKHAYPTAYLAKLLF